MLKHVDSAFVGLLAMGLLFPVPGYYASMIQGVQTEKMKKTDARVQNVTESTSTLSPLPKCVLGLTYCCSDERHPDDQAVRVGASRRGPARTEAGG